MGDENILSQDELDVLLGAEAAGSSGRRVDLHALSEAFLVALQSAGDALTNLLGEAVTLTVEASLVQMSEELVDAAEDRIAVPFQFGDGVQGEVTLVLGEATSLYMASLLLEEQVTDKTQAVAPLAEAMNVMGATLAECIGALIEANVSYAVNPLTWIEQGTVPFEASASDPDEYIVLEVAIDSGDMERSLAHFIVPLDVAEQLLTQLSRAAGEPVAQTAPSKAAPMQAMPVAGASTGGADPVATAGTKRAAPSVRAAEFTALGAAPLEAGNDNLGLLLDVPLRLTVELGRAEMQIRDILSLSKGQVIELDKLAGEPVDVYVNNKLIAKAEVVVMDENFAVKITHIISRTERVQNVQ